MDSRGVRGPKDQAGIVSRQNLPMCLRADEPPIRRIWEIRLRLVMKSPLQLVAAAWSPVVTLLAVEHTHGFKGTDLGTSHRRETP